MEQEPQSSGQTEKSPLSAEAIPAPARVRYAGFWIRLLAYLIDAIILAIVSAIQPTIGTIAAILYFILMTYFCQATLGKMIVGIKVVSSDFSKASFWKIVLRELIGKFISGLILFIGYIMAGFTEKKQALHDMLAKTAVVYKSTLPTAVSQEVKQQ